jgi:hypothetical protein
VSTLLLLQEAPQAQYTITGLLTVVGIVVGAMGAFATALVYMVGRYRKTESEIVTRAIGSAQQTIDFQQHEVDAIRRRLDASEEERKEAQAEVVRLSGAALLLEKEKENVVKLTNALRAMDEGVPVNVKELVQMMTAAASPKEIRRVNGEGYPPVHRETELEERMRLQSNGEDESARDEK